MTHTTEPNTPDTDHCSRCGRYAAVIVEDDRCDFCRPSRTAAEREAAVDYCDDDESAQR